MITREQAPPADYRIPTSISLPVIGAVAALYPAVWNPSQLVNQVGLTIIVIAMVWLALAIRRLILTVTTSAVDRQAKHIRDLAIAEISAADDAEWEKLAQRIIERQPEWLDD